MKREKQSWKERRRRNIAHLDCFPFFIVYEFLAWHCFWIKRLNFENSETVPVKTISL
ncbi:hypothetical protein MtrunA17_Chr1g0163971 [Medicago truncatula]|uniref:Transmembrane protein n=1 Tax=Medicago truncatula TaxID=3880 RepID=A0A396JJ96_MEDTR|nr:hypothetical protein MtrunA17_Chr1g0163971 [Medicago truncatula]